MSSSDNNNSIPFPTSFSKDKGGDDDNQGLSWNKHMAEIKKKEEEDNAPLHRVRKQEEGKHDDTIKGKPQSK